MKIRLLSIRFLSFLILAAGCFSACSHESLTPDENSLTVSKDNPPAKCVEIGPVMGTTQNVNQGSEAALKDLKREASRRSANYLKIGSYSGYGGSVSGTAYRCP